MLQPQTNVGGAGDRIEGVLHARQAPYQMNYIPALQFVILICDVVINLIAYARVWTGAYLCKIGVKHSLSRYSLHFE